MDLRTFQAPTMSAALTEVKQEMGPNAMILQTRSFYKPRWLGLRRREIFEITASRSARSAIQHLPARPAQQPIKPPTPEPRRTLLETPAGENVALIGLAQELSS